VIKKRWMTLAPVAGVAAVAAHDLVQRRHALLRNFPVLGHARYWLEAIGPELRHYVVAGNDE
jgi:glutamate synthase (ferredoxin)